MTSHRLKQQLEQVIKDYVPNPVQQQQLLVDFLLVHLDLRPAFFLEDKHATWNVSFDFQKNLEFIQRIETLGFMVIIGPYYDNHSMISVIINPKRAKTVLQKLEQIQKLDAENPRKHKLIGQVLGYNCAGDEYLNYDLIKFEAGFIFKRNGVQTEHLFVWCPQKSLQKEMSNMVQRLSTFFQSPAFRDFKIELKVSMIQF